MLRNATRNRHNENVVAASFGQPRPRAPARYGANPIGGLCTSSVTKCNTKSAYRNVLAASFGQPDRARLPVTERTQLAAQAQAVLRNATRNRHIGTS
jgi:hypothetical protein